MSSLGSIEVTMTAVWEWGRDGKRSFPRTYVNRPKKVVDSVTRPLRAQTPEAGLVPMASDISLSFCLPQLSHL